MARIPYPNRERTLRHHRRVFPCRNPKSMHYIGKPQWCCDAALLTLGRTHTAPCAPARPDA